MKQKQVIKLNENQLRRIVSESVKRVLNEKLSEEEIEYDRCFLRLSDELADLINNHPLFQGITCKRKYGSSFGEYVLVIKLPLQNNFTNKEEIKEGVNELVNFISTSLMCDQMQVYGDFMDYPYPKVGKGIDAGVKYIKSSKSLKIEVYIPYGVMNNIISKTFPNAHLVSVDPVEYENND